MWWRWWLVERKGKRSDGGAAAAAVANSSSIFESLWCGGSVWCVGVPHVPLLSHQVTVGGGGGGGVRNGASACVGVGVCAGAIL